jgi:hypothetical protein
MDPQRRLLLGVAWEARLILGTVGIDRTHRGPAYASRRVQA